jgi:hypothetical protein
LRRWTNSSGHRANLLLPGGKWIGVAKTSDDRRTYWQWKSLGIEMNEVIALLPTIVHVQLFASC